MITYYFSIECLKTKTKVIKRTDQKKGKLIPLGANDGIYLFYKINIFERVIH